MSKKRGNQPTPGELGFVQQVLLKGDPPLYSKWVTKRKRDKVQDRLIVVGKYRVFSIKKTLTGKKQVQRVGHLYDMVAINSPDIDRVIMKFKDFDIDVQEPGAGTELIAVIRQAFQKISCGFAEYATPKITLLPAERQLQPLPEIDYGIGNGILATYEAFCDYYKLPPSQEFMKYVTDVVSSGSRELIMEQCPGVDRKENPLNFTPIRAALRHNTYFTGFVLRSIPRKEVGLCLADSLMHNVTLEKVIISGVETPDSAFQAIGTAMRKNQYNRIVHIDFSNTPTLKDKGCVGLADGLMATTHGITNLNLAACNIGVKGIQALFQSLCLGNSQVGRELMELDLSYNNINQIGSISMANYFNQEGCGNKLQYLLLSHTKLDVSVITKSLKGGQITTIVELDLSGNKIDAPAGQSLASVIESSQYLQTLNVSSCGLLPPTATAIVSAIASNQYLQSVSVNISANELGPVGAQSISQVIANCNNIGTLVMANCGFKKEGMLKLAEAIGQNNCLKGLDISYNLHTGTSSKMLKVVQALAQAVQRHPTLQHFAIQGDSNKFAVGAELKPLFDCIAQNPTLTELDITGNKIGDQLAVALCDSLRSNNHLKSLLWDKNNVNIGGWQALVNVLGQNRTLISNPPPVYDIDKAIKDSKNKEVFAQRLKEVIDNIQSALKQNSGGQSTAYTSEFEKAKRGRTYTVKPAYQTLRRTQDAPGSPPLSPPSHQSYDYSQTTGFAPPPPPPAYYTDNSYGSYDQSYQEPSTDNYYDPPPPPPERDAYTEEHAYSYEQEYAGEFDDTQYEAAPPPPPPPPF